MKRLRREVTRIRPRPTRPPTRPVVHRLRALGLALWRGFSAVSTLATSVALVIIAFASWETQERQRHLENEKERARFRAEVVFQSPSGDAANATDPFDPKLPVTMTLTTTGTAESVEVDILHRVTLRPKDAELNTPNCHVVFDDWFDDDNRGGPRFQASENARKLAEQGYVQDNEGTRWEVSSDQLLVAIAYTDVLGNPRWVKMEIERGVQRTWEVAFADREFSGFSLVSFSPGSPLVSSAAAPPECSPLLDTMVPLGTSGLRVPSRADVGFARRGGGDG